MAVLIAFSASAQTLIIPQVADGGGWQTTLVLTNTSANSAAVTLSFFEDTTSGNTTAWNPVFKEVSSTQNLTIAGASTLFLHTLGTAATTAQGWAQMQGSATVVASAIFTKRVSGLPDQEGTATAAAASLGVLVPFDNTGGLSTAVGLANPTSASETVSIGIRTVSGTISQLPAVTIPAQGHMAYMMPTEFPATAGQSGLAEFYASTGSLSILTLRANSTGAFTATPVYGESGGPLLAGSSVALPNFSLLTITASSGSASTPELGIGQITVNSGNGGYTGQIIGSLYDSNGVVDGTYSVQWNSVSVQGDTLSFGVLEFTGSQMQINGGNAVPLTSASLTITVNPQGAGSTGTVSGSLNLVSTVATVSGNFTGSYTAH